ncbi:MAG: hypothetical protein ACLSGB_03770 [Dorea sp.]
MKLQNDKKDQHGMGHLIVEEQVKKTRWYGGILRGRDVLCACVFTDVEERNSETNLTILILEKYLDIIY